MFQSAVEAVRNARSPDVWNVCRFHPAKEGRLGRQMELPVFHSAVGGRASLRLEHQDVPLANDAVVISGSGSCPRTVMLSAPYR